MATFSEFVTVIIRRLEARRFARQLFKGMRNGRS